MKYYTKKHLVHIKIINISTALLLNFINLFYFLNNLSTWKNTSAPLPGLGDSGDNTILVLEMVSFSKHLLKLWRKKNIHMPDNIFNYSKINNKMKSKMNIISDEILPTWTGAIKLLLFSNSPGSWGFTADTWPSFVLGGTNSLKLKGFSML